MAMAELSPVSVLAKPTDINKQVEIKQPEMAETAKKVEKTVQTDSITISPQALKMAVGHLKFVRVPPWKVVDK